MAGCSLRHLLGLAVVGMKPEQILLEGNKAALLHLAENNVVASVPILSGGVLEDGKLELFCEDAGWCTNHVSPWPKAFLPALAAPRGHVFFGAGTPKQPGSSSMASFGWHAGKLDAETGNSSAGVCLSLAGLMSSDTRLSLPNPGW